MMCFPLKSRVPAKSLHLPLLGDVKMIEFFCVVFQGHLAVAWMILYSIPESLRKTQIWAVEKYHHCTNPTACAIKFTKTTRRGGLICPPVTCCVCKNKIVHHLIHENHNQVPRAVVFVRNGTLGRACKPSLRCHGILFQHPYIAGEKFGDDTMVFYNSMRWIIRI